MTLWTGVLAILGLAGLTAVTRGLFFLTDRELPMPHWLLRSLRFAPLAALVAVVTPEIVMSQGQLLSTWKDARLFAAAAGLAVFYWRRGILGTIVAGMVVLLALRLGLGW